MYSILLITITLSLCNYSISFPFSPHINRRAVYNNRHYSLDRNGNGEEVTDIQREALSILDCLTSPRDDSDPLYDLEKDIRRDEILARNDYNTLKVELRTRGLRTSGDKLEMITRLLLHVIDPALKFNEM